MTEDTQSYDWSHVTGLRTEREPRTIVVPTAFFKSGPPASVNRPPRQLPPIVMRNTDESDGDFHLRRAAAYTLRDAERNVNDLADDPALVARLRRQISRQGYPPSPREDSAA